MRGLPGRAAAHALAVAADAVAAEREGPLGVRGRAEERLAGLVAWARTASPYYRELYRGLPGRVTDPAVLPPVRKRELMARFDDWVTDPAVTLDGLRRDFLPDLSLVGARYLDRYHVFTTSGTTGEPAVLLHDTDSWLVLQLLGRLRLRHALTAREARAVFRPGVASAAVVATGGHFGAVTLAESVRRSSAFLARHIRVLSALRPLEEIVAELNGLQPTFISGYPSVLAVLAAEQRAGRLRIHPTLAFAAGELLTEAVRSEVLQTLGCRVVEGYAASEAPALSVQCREGAFHVNADW